MNAVEETWDARPDADHIGINYIALDQATGARHDADLGIVVNPVVENGAEEGANADRIVVNHIAGHLAAIDVDSGTALLSVDGVARHDYVAASHNPVSAVVVDAVAT